MSRQRILWILETGGSVVNISIGHFQLEIDVAKTRGFYQTQPYASQKCDCASCRNYAKAVAILPATVKNLFASLGVNIHQQAEAMIPYRLEDGQLMYSAFYHLVGEIISCVKPHESANIADDVSVWFSAECDLVPEGFPPPIVQMFVDAKLPWLLDEECTY